MPTLPLPVAVTGELRHPGLSRDERGVVVGREVLLRFPGLADLVSFLRLSALRGSLDSVLSDLQVQALLAEPGGTDFAVRLTAQNPRSIDTFLDPVRLAGGQVYVGDGRVFVPFRDVDAPFGYDVPGAEEPNLGVVLYRLTGALHYPELRRIDLADLVFSLSLIRDFEARQDGPWLIQSPPGIAPAVSGLLLRHAQGVEAAFLEKESDSRSGERAERFYLFSVKKISAVGFRLLKETPGLRILSRVLDTVLVPLGWRHPLPLESMKGLAPRDGLLVLSAPGGTAQRLPSVNFHPHLPPLELAPIRSAVSAHAVEAPPQRFGLTVNLVPNGRKEDADGILIPAAQQDLLRRLLQGLPGSILEGCRIAAGAEVAIVLGPSAALRSIPLGLLLKARTERIFLPVGTSLVPDPPPETLARMFVGPAEDDYIVLAAREAYHFPERALLPLSRLLIARFYSRRIQLLPHPPEIFDSVEAPSTLTQRLRDRLLGEDDED